MPDSVREEIALTLSSELQELREFTRTGLKLLVQWFIFLATANYGVLLYFGLEMVRGNMKQPAALYCIGALFVAVDLMGVVVSSYAMSWFSKSGAAALEISARIRDLHRLPENSVPIPSTTDICKKLTRLIGITVLLMFFTWLAFCFIGAVMTRHETNRLTQPRLFRKTV